VPAEFLATNSGLAALIVVPAEAGVPTSITFQIDTSTGNPSGFTGTTTIAGPVVLLDSGDVMVGDATLTADLVDAAARAEFEAAVAAGVPATVTIDGVAALDPDSGGILVTITLSIEFEVPTPVATPSVSPTPSPSLLPNTALPADL
jgi:hypothetical protein